MKISTSPPPSFMAHLPTCEKTRLPPVHTYILDEDYEDFQAARNQLLTGDEGGYQEGLLADCELPRDLLSMSGYAKSRYTNERESEINRTMEDPMYIGYSQQGPAVHGLPAHHSLNNRRSQQATYASGSLFSNRSVNPRPASYPSLQGRSIPQVRHSSPTQGPEGTQVHIHLTSAFELNASWNFYARFGEQRISCELSSLPEEGGFFQYMVSTYAPPLSTLTWAGGEVPVHLQAQDASGNTLGDIEAGRFRYTDFASQSTSGSPDQTRKRKLSAEALADTTQPRRTAFEQHDSLGGDGYHDHNYHYDQPPPYGTVPPVATALSGPTAIGHYHDHQELGIHCHGGSSRPSTSFMVTDPALQYRRPSPQTPAWHNNGGQAPLSRSPNLSADSSHGHGMGSPVAAEPRLVRTSELQGSPSPSSTPNGMPAPASFNPYALYPQHKASLKIEGNLADMTVSWSPDENAKQRRLVQFQRSQTGSIITATFKAITPEERQPANSHSQMLTISCIWWKAKQECYVTSVDTIALLESLVAAKFTVEEKNRIRRNLEGFKPSTVSKGKHESEDFFKLIMGFPNPKPRNIEKDVKAFPWRILDNALKKIISKYSASYSSTASSLQPMMTTNYRIGYHPESGHEAHHPATGYNVSETPMTTTYGQLISLPAHASASANRMPLSYSSSVPPAMAHSVHTDEYPLYQLPTSHVGRTTDLLPAMTSHHQHQDSQSHQPRSTWEYGTYVEPPVSNVNDQAMYAMPAGQHQHGQYSTA